MKVLLGATAALMLLASPALAQTQTALPAQCNFTAAPTIPDGATANNNAMRDARTSVEAWRATRQTELAACQAAVQALQAQYQAAGTVYNTAAAETDTVIRQFTAENDEYTARAPTQRRERGSALVH